MNLFGNIRVAVLHSIHGLVSLLALLGVGVHLQTDHGGAVEVDVSASDASHLPSNAETQPGGAVLTLQPSQVLIERLTQEEGYRGLPYKDSLGNLTIGIGTRLPLTRPEAQWLLGERLAACLRALTHLRPVVERVPRPVLDVVADACYANGAEGLAGYHRFWIAVEAGDWRGAAGELRNSKWGREEAPERVARLASSLETLQ